MTLPSQCGEDLPYQPVTIFLTTPFFLTSEPIPKQSTADGFGGAPPPRQELKD